MDFNFSELIKGIAPSIATVLGGPLAGAGVKALSEAIFGDPSKSLEEVVEGVKSLSPDQILAIKKADQDFAVEMERLHNERMKIEADNTASARTMQVAALRQDGKLAKNFVYILATVWSVAAIFYIAFVTFGHIPQENVRFADTILGFLLGTIIATIINYFFGTSLSSKAKDNTVADAVSKMK